MDDKTSSTEVVLYIVGVIAAGYGLIKAFIIGYYPSEALFMYLCIFGGLGLVGIAGSMGKRRKAAAIAARDRSKGVV